MTSYYNIFKNTEFVIQNTNTNNTYKSIKQMYQSGGSNILIYEDIQSDELNTNKRLQKKDLVIQKNTNTNTNTNFFNSCKQSKQYSFKNPVMQIGGFNIQL